MPPPGTREPRVLKLESQGLLVGLLLGEPPTIWSYVIALVTCPPFYFEKVIYMGSL